MDIEQTLRSPPLSIVLGHDVEIIKMFNLYKDFLSNDTKTIDSHYYENNLKPCSDYYNENFTSECFFQKTDQRSIKACAREHALICGRAMPVISRHVSVKGTRRYYVTSWCNFIRKLYPKIMNTKKSFYENIYADDMCRPYVDVDFMLDKFKTEEGVDKIDGILTDEAYSTIMKTLNAKIMDFINSFVSFIHWFYELEDIKVTDIFIMDSSSKKKFSQHIIFHLNDDHVKFKSSVDMMKIFSFISLVCNIEHQKNKLLLLKDESGAIRVQSEEEEGEEKQPSSAHSFFWPNDLIYTLYKKRNPQHTAITSTEDNQSSSNKYIPDMSVFGNTSREFRILGSTKFGETRFLKLQTHLKYNTITHEYDYIVNNDCDVAYQKESASSIYLKNPDLFCNTLICYISQHKNVTRVLDFSFDPKEILKSIQGPIASNCMLASNGITPKRTNNKKSALESEKKDYLSNSSEDEKIILHEMSQDFDKFPPRMQALYEKYTSEAFRGYIFNLLSDDIVQQIPGLQSNDLEPVRYLYTNGIYSVSFRTASKYCEIRGDEHTNNHVYYVALLDAKCFYQRCWSPDCCELMVNQYNENIKKFIEKQHLSRKTTTSAKREFTHGGVKSEQKDLVIKKELNLDGNGDFEEEENQSELHRTMDKVSLKDPIFDNDTVGDNFELLFKSFEYYQGMSCKAETHQFTPEIWGPIQEFLNARSGLFQMYKDFKSGTLESKITTDSILNLEFNIKSNSTQMDVEMEDIDLNDLISDENTVATATAAATTNTKSFMTEWSDKPKKTFIMEDLF